MWTHISLLMVIPDGHSIRRPDEPHSTEIMYVLVIRRFLIRLTHIMSLKMKVSSTSSIISIVVVLLEENVIVEDNPICLSLVSASLEDFGKTEGLTNNAVFHKS